MADLIALDSKPRSVINSCLDGGTTVTICASLSVLPGAAPTPPERAGATHGSSPAAPWTLSEFASTAGATPPYEKMANQLLATLMGKPW